MSSFNIDDVPVSESEIAAIRERRQNSVDRESQVRNGLMAEERTDALAGLAMRMSQADLMKSPEHMRALEQRARKVLNDWRAGH